MNPGVAKRKAARMPMEDDGDLERMEVEPAENGFMVTAHHKPPASKGKKGGPEVMYQPPKKQVFETAHSAVGHIAHKLKRHEARKKR